MFQMISMAMIIVKTPFNENICMKTHLEPNKQSEKFVPIMSPNDCLKNTE